MVGPDDVGDEFDEVDEDERTDPSTVYDVLEVDEQGRMLTIITRSSDEVTIRVDEDDVILTHPAPPVKGRDITEQRIVVPRSALAEAFHRIGLIEE